VAKGKYDDLAADGFGHWLAGFIDGEGCFYLRIGDESRRGIRRNLDIRFSVGVRDDDYEVLEEIVVRTGVGRLSRFRPKSTSNPGARWAVSKFSDLRELIEILDRFPLRAKKRKDYAVWREAVLAYIALERKPGFGAVGFDPVPFERAVVDLRAAREYREAA
jgi:hypothetical protein